MKFKVRWTKEVDFEVEIEAENEEEAKKKACDHDYDAEDDVLDARFKEESIKIEKID